MAGAVKGKPKANSTSDSRSKLGSSKGWKQVELGNDFLLGADESGFAGVEVLEDYSILEGIDLNAIPADGADAQPEDQQVADKPVKEKKKGKSSAQTDDVAKTEDVAALKAQLQALKKENAKLKAKTDVEEGKTAAKADDTDRKDDVGKQSTDGLSSRKRKRLEFLARVAEFKKQKKEKQSQQEEADGMQVDGEDVSAQAEQPPKAAAVKPSNDADGKKSSNKKEKQPKTAATTKADNKKQLTKKDNVPAATLKPAVDISAWRTFGLHPLLEQGIAQLGFSSPTAIQAAVLPAALNQRVDIIGAAQTGSGKTLAFGLPIMQALLQEREAAEADGVEPPHQGKLRALIMAPTRELALQVCSHLQAVGKVAGIRVISIVGGLAHVKQERLLKSKPAVVVATPGRLWELLRESSAPHLVDLTGLRFLVLDEADRMVQKGHFQELSEILALIPRPGTERQETYDRDFVATLDAVSKLEQQHGGSLDDVDMEASGDADADADGEADNSDDDADQDMNTEEDDDGVTDEQKIKAKRRQDGSDAPEGLHGELEKSSRPKKQRQGSRDAKAQPKQARKVKGGQLIQTMVFSATLTLPAGIRKRLRRGGGGALGGTDLENLMDRVPFRDNPLIVDLSGQRRLAQGVSECMVQCMDGSDRDAVLYYLLAKHPGRALVFVNAVSALRRVAALLKLLGLPAYALHAQQQQRQRLKALDQFKNKPNTVLVATDVAARGLDVKDIRMVIHYQLPASVDTYIHRCGRTARGAAQEGLAVALVAPEEAQRWNALIKALAKSNQPRKLELQGTETKAEEEEKEPEVVGPPAFPIDATIMPQVVERIKIAMKIDEVERSRRKQAADESWALRTAKEIGLDTDEVPFDDDDDEALRNRRMDAKKEEQIATMKAQLSALVAQPLAPKMSRSYFTGGAVAGVSISSAAARGGNVPSNIGNATTTQAAGPADANADANKAAKAQNESVAKAVALASQLRGGMGPAPTTAGVSRVAGSGKVVKQKMLSKEELAMRELAKRRASKEAKKGAKKGRKGSHEKVKGSSLNGLNLKSKGGKLVVIPASTSRDTQGQDALAALRRKIAAIQ